MKKNTIKLGIIFPILLSVFSINAHSGNANISHPPNPIVQEENVSHFIKVAKSMLNTKYSFGGNGKNGIDCSGLVKYVFRDALGVNLYGPAREIAKQGYKIPKDEALKGNVKIGDLLFFNTTGKSHSHVGIVISKDKFIHASSTMKKVVISNIHNNYYKKRLELVKRI